MKTGHEYDRFNLLTQLTSVTDRRTDKITYTALACYASRVKRLIFDLSD